MRRSIAFLMPMPLRKSLLLAVSLLVSACGAITADSSGEPEGGGGGGPGGGGGGAGGGGGGGASSDGGGVPQEPLAPWEDVIEVGRLHQIKITCAASDVPMLETLGGDDVPCDVEFDGVAVKSVGVHQKGSVYSGCRCLKLPCKNPKCETFYADKVKPGLKLKFDAFVKTQHLFGLKKLILNNGHQDLSFLSAHIVYELFRRAGLAAPHTAFGQVVINGIPLGLYNVEENTDSQMMRRNFGDGNDQGNLYEGAGVDFVTNPLGPGVGSYAAAQLQLDDEAKDMRSRDDLIALGGAILGSPDGTFEADVSKLIDLDRFITARAIEAVGPLFDNYSSNLNNYYLYDNPKDNRFVFIPHGADCALAVKYDLQDRVDKNACTVDADCEARSPGAVCLDPPGTAGATKYCIKGSLRWYPTTTPFPSPRGRYSDIQVEAGRLGMALQDIPSLSARYEKAVAKVSSAPLWDPDPAKGWMLARINEAASLLKTAKSDGARMDDDVMQFQLNRPLVEAYIKAYGNSRKPRLTGAPKPAPAPNRVPVIVSTDLFYPAPPAAVDDYFDLVALLSMPEVDVRAVILDNALPGEDRPQVGRPSADKFLGRPGFRALSQIETMIRQRTPSAIGIDSPMASAVDKAEGADKVVQGGVDLIRSNLRGAADDSVTLVTLGSLRDVAVAYNRDKDTEQLFKKKVHRLLVFAGEAAPNPAANVKDYNVELDHFAFAAIMNSDLPIFWVPRAHTGQAAGTSNHGSAWITRLADTFEPLAAPDCPRMDEPNGYCLPLAFLMNVLGAKATPPAEQHSNMMWALFYPTYQLSWTTQILDKTKVLTQNLWAGAVLAAVADKTVAYDGTNPPALVATDWVSAPPTNALFGFSDADVKVSDKGYVTAYAAGAGSHRVKRFNRLVDQTTYAGGMGVMTGKMAARLNVPGI